MTLINVVHFESMKHFSLGIMFVSDCYVSITRLSNFLNMPEVSQTILSKQMGHDCNTQQGNELPLQVKEDAITISKMACHCIS